ncbi:unnamed protein product [Caenorhabditis angaria]|uniref:Domain of unknown function DX domain-containing protein n=1 Tax=Caenorhabditis angaria TaxID=860376 RepID=A0A9P1I7G6_9PELO|nr:unnamed protein product [Caenorhabditis angaria]
MPESMEILKSKSCDFMKPLDNNIPFTFCDYETEKVAILGRRNKIGKAIEMFDVKCDRNWDCQANSVCVNFMKGKKCARHPNYKLYENPKNLDSTDSATKSSKKSIHRERDIIRNYFYRQLFAFLVAVMVIFI